MTMKISYDNEVDALYIQFGNAKADGVIEIAEGINVDVSTDGRVIGIELLDASRKIDMNTVLTYNLDLGNKKFLV
jgi:uncharacterized protein YuzE